MSTNELHLRNKLDNCEMIVLIIKVGNEVWEKCIVCPDSIILGQDLDNVIRYPSIYEDTNEEKELSNSTNYLLMQEKNDHFIQAVHIIKLCGCFKRLLTAEEKSLTFFMDSRLLSCFINELRTSENYRKSVITNFINYYSFRSQFAIECERSKTDFCEIHLKALVYLQWPEKLKIDYSWCEKMERLEMEKAELENLMAWLSTLGGAYSALGDEISQCAETAGKISLQQLKIAMTLGDPITSAKCKVYFAISLIQQGYLSEPMIIIKQQYHYGKSLHENLRDIRLIRMCKGVWAKMQYLYSLRKKSLKQNG